jgi:hypothetical protein
MYSLYDSDRTHIIHINQKYIYLFYDRVGYDFNSFHCLVRD